MRRRIIENRRKIFFEKLNNINCPECNSYMVPRKAKKGKNAGSEFYGCYNFPKCNATLSKNTSQNPYSNLSYDNLLREENRIFKGNEEKKKVIVSYKEALNSEAVLDQEKKEEIENIKQQINEKTRVISSELDNSNNSIKNLLIVIFSIGIATYLIKLLPFELNFYGLEVFIYFLVWIIPCGISMIFLKFIFAVNDDSDIRSVIYKKTYSLNKELENLVFEEKERKQISLNNKKIVKDKLHSLENEVLDNNILLEYLNQKKKKTKERERTAKIAAYEGNARTGTISVKQQLLNVCSSKFKCPYCNNKTFREDSDADHIYPIAKGGLTTFQNMVLICKKCNASKSSNTLRVFSTRNNYNYLEICSRLEAMGKDV